MNNAASAKGIDLPISEHRLCARVARLYYESDQTQEQIGELLGLSRMKVNRLLRLALKTGVIQIRIFGPDEEHADLQHDLLSRFRLKDVVVVSDPLPEQTLVAVLAEAAAGWLAERLAPGVVVGLGLGRTVARFPDTFGVPRPVPCRFVTLEGVGTSPNAGFAAYDVTSRLADAAGGTAEIISAPTYVSSRIVRDALLKEPSVRSPLELARNATLMIQSVGSLTADAPLFRHGTLSADDLTALAGAGAVGDALGHFFDAEGRHIPWRTDDLNIGLTLEDLKACPTSALVAGGDRKVPAILAALRGGFFNVLITDATTARAVLEAGE